MEMLVNGYTIERSEWVTRTSNKLRIVIILNIKTGLDRCGFPKADRTVLMALKYFSLATSKSYWSLVTLDMAASPTAMMASRKGNSFVTDVINGDFSISDI